MEQHSEIFPPAITAFALSHPALEQLPVLTALAPGTVNFGAPVLCVGVNAGAGVGAVGVAVGGAAAAGVGAGTGVGAGAGGPTGTSAGNGLTAPAAGAAAGLIEADRCLWDWQYRNQPPFLRFEVSLLHPTALHMFARGCVGCVGCC